MWSIFGGVKDTRLGVSRAGYPYIQGKGEFLLRVLDDEEHSGAEDRAAISRISNIKRENFSWSIFKSDDEPSDFAGPIVRNLVRSARSSPLKTHGMILFMPAMTTYGFPDSLTSNIILPDLTFLQVQRLFEMVLINNLRYDIEIQSRRFWSESENQQASSWRDFESGMPHFFSSVIFSVTGNVEEHNLPLTSQ
jgi:hypothetical protein